MSKSRCYATNFGTKIAINLLCVNDTIATRPLVMKGGGVSGRPREYCRILQTADTLDLRDVATATSFWLSMGYNFGCMIASDALFDSRGGFSGSSYPMET